MYFWVFMLYVYTSQSVSQSVSHDGRAKVPQPHFRGVCVPGEIDSGLGEISFAVALTKSYQKQLRYFLGCFATPGCNCGSLGRPFATGLVASSCGLQAAVLQPQLQLSCATAHLWDLWSSLVGEVQ